MNSIKQVVKYEVEGVLFNTEEEAKKYLFSKKLDNIIALAKENNTIAVLEEMLNQGIHNKNKIKILIGELQKA